MFIKFLYPGVQYPAYCPSIIMMLKDLTLAAHFLSYFLNNFFFLFHSNIFSTILSPCQNAHIAYKYIMVHRELKLFFVIPFNVQECLQYAIIYVNDFECALISQLFRSLENFIRRRLCFDMASHWVMIYVFFCIIAFILNRMYEHASTSVVVQILWHTYARQNYTRPQIRDLFSHIPFSLLPHSSSNHVCIL